VPAITSRDQQPARRQSPVPPCQYGAPGEGQSGGKSTARVEHAAVSGREAAMAVASSHQAWRRLTGRLARAMVVQRQDAQAGGKVWRRRFPVRGAAPGMRNPQANPAASASSIQRANIDRRCSTYPSHPAGDSNPARAAARRRRRRAWSAAVRPVVERRPSTRRGAADRLPGVCAIRRSRRPRDPPVLFPGHQSPLQGSIGAFAAGNG
jgi:hypothetical protein